MLRRIFDGLLMALVAWFALARLDAGALAVGIVLAGVFLFTGWRINKLWRRYRHLLVRLAEAQTLAASDDPAERSRAERMLRERGLMQAAEMSLWSGFMMGAAADSGGMFPGGAEGGDGGGYVDGAGEGGGHGGGGYGGGDIGGGGFGGGMDGGM